MPVKLRKYNNFFDFPVAHEEPLCNCHRGQGLNHLPVINAHAKENDHGDEEEEEGQEGFEEVISSLDAISFEMSSPSEFAKCP
jgi:hypothetical protein